MELKFLDHKVTKGRFLTKIGNGKNGTQSADMNAKKT